MAEELDYSLPSLLPSAGLGVEGEGASFAQSHCRDCAACPLWGLWCLVEHSLCFEDRHTHTPFLSPPATKSCGNLVMEPFIPLSRLILAAVELDRHTLCAHVDLLVQGCQTESWYFF